MKILSINNNYNKINFRGFERTVYKAGKSAVDENILHRNNSYILRTDLPWKEVARKIIEKFKNVDKVSTFIYACSDGREPISLLIALDSIADEKEANKFYPIVARDYDIFAINQAKANFYEITEEEKNRINSISNNKFYEYFTPVSKIKNRYKATKKLTDRIIYEVGDFTKEYSNLPKENVILATRNCWPYFSMTNQYTLPRKVCNHFDKNAVLLLGDFDFTTQEESDFTQNGFNKLDRNAYRNIFMK